MWQFVGDDEYSSNTLLDFSILQPLLRAGGRTRVLERLTISERNLLANVREMDRFRERYYVSVVTGIDPGQGPTRRGGVFGGSGLSGFTGVGGGGFGQVGNNFGNGFGGGGNGGNFTGWCWSSRSWWLSGSFAKRASHPQPVRQRDLTSRQRHATGSVLRSGTHRPLSGRSRGKLSLMLKVSCSPRKHNTRGAWKAF